MKLTAQLRAVVFFEALHKAGLISDPGAVDRVVIDAQRGRPVAIHVKQVADSTVLRVAPLLDGLALDPVDGGE